MTGEVGSAPELESVAWEVVQGRVQSFRQALRRGECPEIEAYAPEGTAHREVLLFELVHEELEVRIKAGERFEVAAYLARFAELAHDPQAVAELVAAESELRRRMSPEPRPEPVCTPSGVLQPADRPAPRGIGRYELGDVIGQGAFGIVHRARDTTLNRAVALKRPRPGVMDAPGAVERFLREARSVATLRHPHIVPVYDAGQVEGQPYLVSALIDGRNLAEALAAGRPGSRQATAWIASLAEALDHAHRSGVIHRDVKPSNVLIDREDRAYLTDFGLAKSDGGGATLTIDGQMIGTPAYMAPEQARSDKEAVDARTDVYSLGIVLYELLTGVRPFQGSERMLLLRIQEEEPVAPRRLDDAIPRDLETVCLEAIAKEPGRRYPDAASFAADLHRFLRGEPVVARRAGPLGTLWRHGRRKPVVTGLAAALALAVLLGFAGVTWQWRRAHSQREQALQALRSGVGTLSYALHLSMGDPGRPDDVQQRRDTLLDAARTSLLDQGRTYPELRETLGSVTMAALKVAQQGASKEAALSACEKTRTAFECLVRDNPTYRYGRDCVARCLGGEGTLLIQMGRIEEGVARLRESVVQWELYGACARDQAENSPADRSAREAWIRTELALAEVQIRCGRKAEALAGYRRARALAEGLVQEHPGSQPACLQLVGTLSRLALFLRDEAPGEAISLHRRACALLEQMAGEHPSDRAVQEELGRSLSWLAAAEDRADRCDEAIRDHRRTIALVEGLRRHRPLDTEFRGVLSTSYHVLGRLLVDTGRPGEAPEPYRSSIALREELSRDDPTNPRWHSDCAGSWHRLGEALEILGQITEAVQAYQRSVAHQRRVAAQEPGEIKHRRFLEERLQDLFRLLLAHGRPVQALSVAWERVTLRPVIAAPRP
jgi:serine/threonine-protein kinase